MLKMGANIQHFRHIMISYFKKDKNTTEMQNKKICAVYGEGAVTDQTCQKWFAKFVLEVSCLMMLHGWVGQLKLIVIEWRH